MYTFDALRCQITAKSNVHSVVWSDSRAATGQDFASLGNCDSRVARSLKPLFSCFSNSYRNLLMASSISS